MRTYITWLSAAAVLSFHLAVVEVAGVHQPTLLQLLEPETLCRRYNANVREFAFQVVGIDDSY